MSIENDSIITLPTEIINRKEFSLPDSQKLSHFWIVNHVINSLFSSNNTHNNELVKNSYFKGSLFEEIRFQLNVIANNLELIRINEKENSNQFQVWKELGSCVSEFITELLEKWDLKLCELQHHHLNNCEVLLNELVSEFNQINRKVKGIDVIEGFDKEEDLWGDEQLFWEIDSVYPFREFQFGLMNEETICSTPITIVYLSSILHPYISIWSNIRSFFNILVNKVFLSNSTNIKNVEIQKSELNIFILETLFDNIEKSILIIDEYILNIWTSLLRKCICSFAKLVPNTQSSLKKFPSSKGNNSVEFYNSISILSDILNYFNKYKTCYLYNIGNIFGIQPKNEISKLDFVLRTIKIENQLSDIPIELLNDIHLQDQSKAFPINMLFTSNQDNQSQAIQRRYTFQNNIGKSFRELNRDLKMYYKELFIKEDNEIKAKLCNPIITKLIKNHSNFENHQGIRIINILSCLRDLVILEESSTEQLIKTLRLDSKKKFPNIDVDPTEANLSIKLLYNKGLKDEDKELKRKIMSMFLLEFEVSNTKDYIKGQLPTFYSLKIRLNNINLGLNSNINLSNNQILICGIPSYLILQFFGKDIMEDYSNIFSFLLEVKRCSLFLNQVFQTLTEINREKQGILLCKQKVKKIAKDGFDYIKFCNNNCSIIMKWVDLLLYMSQKMRFSIQFIVDIYYSYFSIQSPIIWEELKNNLSSNNSVSFMIKSHKIYIEKLHKLVLAPNKRKKDNLGIDQSFQSISISFVLLLKLGRKLNILTYKVNQLVQFLSNVNNVLRNRKYVPCMILRRKVQQTVKKIVLAFEVLHSEFNEAKQQFLNSLNIYIMSNPNKEMEFLLLQLNN
ncbi:uncharacterized protein cubi_00305 [Cryptosporidium ubiquitum]|uniref:Gamma tubulin complex component C-terminal domain-containing protein n=1 Tax=Cryptosporidium ubiquitum TaxID=857276 RepID=A0A1J4MKL1_9CRYT|nr:uncharacterized protein cubi_00305 [Cryptosporidium ubiquitum]OII74752.1 hypothetical protein cubi_00305 [Cryptosporidium ubiquitum]